MRNNIFCCLFFPLCILCSSCSSVFIIFFFNLSFSFFACCLKWLSLCVRLCLDNLPLLSVWAAPTHPRLLTSYFISFFLLPASSHFGRSLPCPSLLCPCFSSHLLYSRFFCFLQCLMCLLASLLQISFLLASLAFFLFDSYLSLWSSTSFTFSLSIFCASYFSFLISLPFSFSHFFLYLP